ncbi:MAG TPA: type II secretion system F family protein [Gemmataceae bacterium]|jgi:tight adherence protein B|nr:type II secretion system F family protein [Gemmataceae bacterium]
MDPTTVAVVAFLVVAGIIAVIAVFYLRDADRGRAAERLDVLVGKGGRRESASDLLLKQAMLEVDKKNILDALTPKFLSMERMFEQADANIKPSALFAISIGLTMVGGMLSALIARTMYVAPVGAALFFSIPWLWLWNKRRARLKKFASQLPDALELVARALRAGHSLAAGLHVVSEEMPAPISREFGRVYEEQNLGIPLDEALRSITDRVPNLDLRFFVTSVAIQRQTGGDLAEILDKIGHVIRERYRILGQVKALTAEGRLSGLVLVALPFGLFLMMLHMKPDYISLLWTDPLGVKLSIFALVLQVLGAYAIKKIVDIKV